MSDFLLNAKEKNHLNWLSNFFMANIINLKLLFTAKDLYGLEAVAQKCNNLRELNVSNLHIHASDNQLNRLCSIIGEMKNLKKLSIPACSLVNNISVNQSPEKAGKKSSTTSPLCKAETFKPSSLLVSLDSSNPSFTASPSTSANNPPTTPEKSTTHPTTRLSRQINNDETLVNAIGSGLDPIVKGCCDLEELEIVDVGFHSPFNRVVCEQFIWYEPLIYLFYISETNLFLHVISRNTFVNFFRVTNS